MATSPYTHFCYILANDKNNVTYNGYTTNLERRLRQHNMEIKGGAKCTTRQCAKAGARWRYVAVVTTVDPRFDKIMALRLEWRIRYPTGKRPRPKEFNGVEGRLAGARLAMAHEKFSDIDGLELWGEEEVRAYQSSTPTK